MIRAVWLKICGFYDKIGSGSVAEWLKAHDSKSCGPLRVSEVRILSLPPHSYGMYQKAGCRISLALDANPLASATILP